MSQKSHNAQTEKRYIQNKMNEIENYNIDFHGQTIFEKMEENVTYFTNPIKQEDERELQDLKSLNMRFEKLKAERRRLVKKKNNQIRRNKNKIDEIKKLREMIEDEED